MILNDMTGNNPERKKVLDAILPKQTIIETVLEPSIEKRLFKILAECVRQELEIYRKYPKADKKEEPKAMVKDFDPRTNEKCFMGKGFQHNTDLTDSHLETYRRAIGTIPHPVWGKCTLLEIWGGDHFEDYNKMVVGAFKYGMNMINTCPTIKFHINPLFQNKKSKSFKLSPAQQEYKDEMELLTAKAMIYGVKGPKESLRERKRRLRL